MRCCFVNFFCTCTVHRVHLRPSPHKIHKLTIQTPKLLSAFLKNWPAGKFSGINSPSYTVIRFMWVSAKFGTCTVESVNGTFVAAKMCTFTLESTHFIFIKCPIYTHDSERAKFSTNSHETVYRVADESVFIWRQWGRGGLCKTCTTHRNCRKKSLMIKDHYQLFMCIVAYLYN